ncbi:MAG TPA: hypothetical protein PKD64_02915 [Pirellulaceae bacterium]|nr:hypothetical protein [Pirellulaceae bacterium]HMO91120.1 hypothetical protein [Pirellulaceae bacterium]HMP70533.1 hypothetical protein [Pirellulaceae bacterium]
MASISRGDLESQLQCRRDHESQLQPRPEESASHGEWAGRSRASVDEWPGDIEHYV